MLVDHAIVHIPCWVNDDRAGLGVRIFMIQSDEAHRTTIFSVIDLGCLVGAGGRCFRPGRVGKAFEPARVRRIGTPAVRGEKRPNFRRPHVDKM